MPRGFVVSGVNVRPHKPAFESQAPTGIRISGAYSIEGSPSRRPLPGYRTEDFRPNSRKRAPVVVKDAVPIGMRVENARREWQLATQAVKHARSEGAPTVELAVKARALRACLTELEGAPVVSRTIEISQGSPVNPVKAAA